MRRMAYRRMGFQPLEPRRLLTTTFGRTQLVADGLQNPHTVVASDMDADGDLDVLTASSVDGALAWYENQDGIGGFGRRHLITSDIQGVWSIVTADLDGDGDSDILTASGLASSDVVWLSNRGDGTFERPQSIGASSFVRSVHAADLDADGDLDVLAASPASDRVTWYENDGTGQFNLATRLQTTALGAWSVTTADINNDEKVDIVVGFETDDTVAWYENDGTAVFSERIISDEVQNVRDVHVSDVDNDGRVDILAASYGTTNTGAGGRAFLFENTIDGFNPRIVASGNGISSIDAQDFDNDGIIDVATAALKDNTVAWHQGTGNGRFRRAELTSSLGGAQDVHAADIDGDGDPDVVATGVSDGKVHWFRNADLLRDGKWQFETSPTASNVGTVDDLTLRRNLDTLEVYDNQLNAVRYSRPLDEIESVLINGQSGAIDRLVVDFSGGGFWGLEGDVVFQGQNTGADELVVIGSDVSARYDFAERLALTFSQDGENTKVRFFGVEPLLLQVRDFASDGDLGLDVESVDLQLFDGVFRPRNGLTLNQLKLSENSTFAFQVGHPVQVTNAVIDGELTINNDPIVVGSEPIIEGAHEGEFTNFQLPFSEKPDNATVVNYSSPTEVTLDFSVRPGDLNCDGVVDAIDLNVLGENWLKAVDTWFEGDLNGDGLVNEKDLNILGRNWGSG